MTARRPPGEANTMHSVSRSRAADECMRLARQLSRRPANRDGADKTWVLELMRGIERFFSSARRLPAKKRHGSLR